MKIFCDQLSLLNVIAYNFTAHHYSSKLNVEKGLYMLILVNGLYGYIHCMVLLIKNPGVKINQT